MKQGEVLVPKPRVTALLWVHYGFRPNDKGDSSNTVEVFCKICRKKVPVKGSTNLKRHRHIVHSNTPNYFLIFKECVLINLSRTWLTLGLL